MRYFDEKLVANSRPHQAWWSELSVNREWFHRTEAALAQVANASPILPRDAWLEMDAQTRSIMRADGGETWMSDLMPLAKPVNIGALVHMTRVASDMNNPIIRSMSGQVPVPMDKTAYDYRGTPVPIFSGGYGREWREWNTLQNANFDALSDDQETTLYRMRRDQALFVLNGDPQLKVKGFTAWGIRNHPLSKAINLGAGGGGANIDLTAGGVTADAIDAFFNGPFGVMLDNNLITAKVNLYISPEIARNWDRSYSGSAGFKGGSLRAYLEGNRRINKIEVSTELVGNQFFGFVPNAQFIRPLVGMAVNTTAITRQNPTDNYQFLVMGAMGLEIRADGSGKSGVFYSTNV